MISTVYFVFHTLLKTPPPLQISDGANFNDVVTAKRGTLRRKKQMREFLDAYDRGYEDNIFDSTPYRNRSQKIKVSPKNVCSKIASPPVNFCH